jgi:transcriptional regulator with XRE-family HTH domain
MSKHEDLKAARTIANLGQKEAAQKAGVSPEYLCRMEKGKSPIPEATYLKFLEAIGKTQADIDAYFANLPAARQPPSRQITDLVVEEYIHGLPRPRAEALCASILRKHPQPAAAKIEYDRKGYPLNVGPFDAVEYDRSAFEKKNPGVYLDDILIEIEGKDFPALDRIRQVKFTERRWPNNKDEDHLQERAKAMREWDDETAAYFAELALEHGWPVDEEKARAMVEAARIEKAKQQAEAKAKAERDVKEDAERRAQQEAQRKLEADPEYQAKKKAEEAEARERSCAAAEKRMRGAKYDVEGYPQEYPAADLEAAQGNLQAMLDYNNGLMALEGPYYRSMCERRETLRKERLLKQARIRQLEEGARLRRLEDEDLA